jgi:tetratricopeptide (TPR) repeat protein
VGLVLLTVAGPPARAATPAEERSWTEIHSPHFTVLSSAPFRRTLDIVMRLERYQQTLSTIFSRITLQPAVETLVYVFNDDAAMTPYKVRHNGRPVDLLGYFAARRDANYVVINGGGQTDPLRTVYHEMMHEFEHLHLPPLPPWFSEGLAECYGTFRAVGRTAEIGLVHEGHVALLRALPVMPLRDLFAVTHDATDYNEGDRRGVFYAESWALVHYLLWDKPERREQLVRFLGGLGQGRTPTEAFAAAFDVTIEQLEVELKRQIEQTRFHQTKAVFKEELSFGTTAKARDLDRGETEARLGDLLAHMEPEFQAEAEAMLQKSFADSPGNALASRALGLVRLGQGRAADAAGLFEAALAADPRDAIAAMMLAEMLQDDRARARDLLARAVKTRPEFAEAAVSYARSLLLDPGAITPVELESSISTLEKARERLPYRPDAAANLAILYAIKGDFERARDIVVRVLPGLGNPGAVEFARTSVNYYRHLADLKTQRANAMKAAPGPGQEAATAEPGDGAPSPAAAQAQPGKLPPLPQDAVARDLVSAIRPIAHSDYDEVVLFNRAAELGNDRKYQDAIRSLVWLMAMTTNAELRNRAGGLVEKMRNDAARLRIAID